MYDTPDLDIKKSKIWVYLEKWRKVESIMKSRLNGKNKIIAINTWAVSLVKYGAGIVKWTKSELRHRHRKIRNHDNE